MQNELKVVVINPPTESQKQIIKEEIEHYLELTYSAKNRKEISI